MAAFKVPKSFIGYEEDTSGKATLAAQDVRFARTIERIQRIVVSELNKIAIVHLYTLGYRDEELVDFSLSLTNPSMVYEMEKIPVSGFIRMFLVLLKKTLSLNRLVLLMTLSLKVKFRRLHRMFSIHHLHQKRLPKVVLHQRVLLPSKKVKMIYMMPKKV
jgi:hypothetical protein